MRSALPIGATIGILGGGQLGRMLSMAATQLGYKTHIYTPESNSPAAHIAHFATIAPWDDDKALAEFAKQCDVVTCEFENVPAHVLDQVNSLTALYPKPNAFVTAQSRKAEKDFVTKMGGRTADYAFAETRVHLDRALAITGKPAIIKSNTMGYDGKGQARVTEDTILNEAWQQAGNGPAIVEAVVPFLQEFSIILVRGQDGEIRFYDAPQNQHDDGILVRSTLPASEEVAIHIPAARGLARKIANEMDYVGTLTIEFFVTEREAIFNEMAPRVHNSGHWTIEGARTSQFENHIRAICGLPLGDTAMVGKEAEMENLIGEQINGIAEILCDPRAHYHHYGKKIARPGRKMGHVTRIFL